MNMAHGIPEAGSGHLGRAGQDPRAHHRQHHRHHRMFINIMISYDFECLFAKGASEWSRNDRFYKGPGTGFCSMRKSMFSQPI